MSGLDRSTGGNRFIRGDATTAELADAIEAGLLDLAVYALNTDRRLDPGAVTVTTRRVPSGLISVSVTGDLTSVTPAGAVQ